MESPRPPVSVVVPFHGDAKEARETLVAMGRMRLRAGDELVVADNTGASVVERLLPPGAVHAAASEMRSSYYARNVGAEAASNEWLLFLDADCAPGPCLLDEYFRDPLDAGVGAVAGEVLGEAEQRSLAARYSRSRRHIGQAEIRDHPYKPMAVTANLLVRRAVWEALGGFHEGIRSGGDADFSWRLQDAGWTLAYSAAASVEHRHRETLRALLRQSARYGAGMRWLRRRHPGATFGGHLGPLARCAVAIPVLLLTARFERAAFKGLDALWVAANAIGSLAGNAHRDDLPGAQAVIFADQLDASVASEARRLGGTGQRVLVEAARRPPNPDRSASRGLTATYLEDDGPALRLRELLWLAVTRPLRAAADQVRRGGRRGRPLRELAPSARRIASSGAAEVRASGGERAQTTAVRLARLVRARHTVPVDMP